MKSAKYLAFAVAVAVLMASAFAQNAHESSDKKAKNAGGQTISASSDQTGQHPGTAAVPGPASVTCTSAASDIPNPQPRPSCNIVAPGSPGDVPVGTTIGTSGAGTVSLTCNGQGNRLNCSARIQFK